MKKSKQYPQEDRENNLKRIAQVKSFMRKGLSYSRACTEVAYNEGISTTRVFKMVKSYVDRGIISEFRPSKLEVME